MLQRSLFWCVLLAVILGCSFVSAQMSMCGDGVLNRTVEDCDDYNTMSGDGCSENCTIEIGYMCRHGFDMTILQSRSICVPICGDGIVIWPEECDDNNTMIDDGCRDDCLIEEGFSCESTENTVTGFNFSICSPVCGDGIVVIFEECDDNNTMNGDGCGSDCMIEQSYECDTIVNAMTGFNISVCGPVCGDGRVILPETCDDNNTVNGDGCGSDCMIELGFTCNITVDIMTGFNTSVCGPVCGDGRVIFPELCDDNNTRSGDGCSDSCQIEDQFECLPDGNRVSVCVAVTLLDLNAFDSTTLNYTNEFFDLNTIVYLSDPNLTNMTSYSFLQFGGNWTAVYVVILGNVSAFNDQEADVYPMEALQAGRTTQDFRGVFSMTQLNPNDPRIQSISRPIARAYRIVGDNTYPGGDGDEELSPDEVFGVLRTLGYMADSFPGFETRDICLIAEDSLFRTTACVTLDFIGRNMNPPTLTYERDGVANFTEGGIYPVKFIVGNLTVTDMDHPTRYLIQSAQASIVGFRAGQAEVVAVTYELPGFTYQFDNTSGNLTITGPATTDVYSEILSNLTYINNMFEPTGASRTIRITVFDGMFTSNQISVQITIVNLNDAPQISLDGEAPVITSSSTNYTEGSGPQAIVPNLFVVDTDPMDMIRRATVELRNPVDGEREIIAVGDTQGLNLSRTSHFLELSGQADPQTYTDVLRTLTYEHTDANPGNPCSDTRQIVFYVEDDDRASHSQNSTLSLTFVPVNDAPILLYVTNESARSSPTPVLTGETVQSFSYIEDDPAINIGQDIYLRDIDGNIMSATIRLAGLFNADQDRFYFNDALLEAYNVTQNVTTGNGNLNREIVLTGEATPRWYEQILQSLQYRNLHMNDSVTDGLRTALIFVQDTGNLISGNVTAYVNVMDRNDGPVVTLTDEADSMTTFVENGPSVPIGFSHLIRVMDEEGHNISSMDVTLVATNGNLDPEESVFLHTPMPSIIVTDPRTRTSETSIHIEINAEPELYVQTLQNILYSNRAAEPTLFNATGSNLTRQVVVRITDAAVGSQTTTEFRVTVVIEPINDNAPRIIINTSPKCSEDCRDDPGIQKTRSRRDVKVTGRRRKRTAYSLTEEDTSMAPRLQAANAHFTNQSCLSNITLLFNTNTSAPVVEIQPDLGFLLHLDPPELNKALQRGRWSDYQTLVVVFEKCVEWERMTTNGRERPMFVMFEAQRDSCDWASPCTSGVCFSNTTGCPTTGLHRIMTNLTTVTPTPLTTDNNGELNMYYRSLLVTVALIVLAVVLMCLVLSCQGGRKKRSFTRSKMDVVEAGTLPTKTQKPVPTNTNREDSVVIQISTLKNSGVQEITNLPGKVERVSPLNREDTPQKKPSLASKPPPSPPPGQGGHKKHSRSTSPSKKKPPDPSKGSKVTPDSVALERGVPSTQISTTAVKSEGIVEERLSASEDEKSSLQQSQQAVQDVCHRVWHARTDLQGQRSHDQVANCNHTPSSEQSTNSNTYDSLTPERQHLAKSSQSTTH